MTTAVQPTQVSSPGETGSALTPLTTWLTAPVETVEENAQAFVTALQSTHVLPEAREAVAGALLKLLSADGTRNRTVRRACVEAVLQLGYPWALQLDADDVADAREAAQAARPASRWRRALVAVTAGTVLGVGALVAAMTGWSHVLVDPPKPTEVVLRPAPVAPKPPSAVVQTAANVTQLRVMGDVETAVGVAEACAVTFAAPQPCVKQLSTLASDAASRNNDSFERYAARQWATLAEEPDAALVREHGRVLLSHDFARDASFLPPLDDLGAQLLMGFVESELRLERTRQWQAMASNAANCVDSGGQVGVVCRAFYVRAMEQQQLPPVGRPADRPVTADSEVVDRVRRIINLRVKDKLDDAIAEANLCLGAAPTATDCQHLLVDALTRRYRDEHDPADKRLADRWREALKSGPQRAVAPPKAPQR
ncbi:MAG: hypothetical protein JNM69_19710 [Archangium sp.]|nr:hypothetical protein [Archangium sp.]